MQAGLAVALNPMKPGDHLVIPGTTPPMCPNHRVGLENVKTNEKGDLLFECLAGGDYMAVWRSAYNLFECPPAGVCDDAIRASWVPPFTGEEPEAEQPKAARASKKIERKPVTVETAGPDTSDTFLTLNDAAVILNVKPSALLAAVREGKLVLKDGTVSENSLMAFGGRA